VPVRVAPEAAARLTGSEPLLIGAAAAAAAISPVMRARRGSVVAEEDQEGQERTLRPPVPLAVIPD
jgi:hypothetical protein